jgi:hypothetical protein
MDLVSDEGTLPLGWWTTADALLWAERTHPPVHLTGRPFALWESHRGPDGAGPRDEDRAVVDRLRALGLLGGALGPRSAAPAPDEEVALVEGVGAPVALERIERAAWSATPAPSGSIPRTRCRRTPAGWVVANAANDLPVAVLSQEADARELLQALGDALTTPDPAALRVPLTAVTREGGAVLVSPALLTDATVRMHLAGQGHEIGGPISRIVGITPAVAGPDGPPVPVQGLVLDRSWAAANPEAGSLLLRWVLACLLAAANDPGSTGRYALLDAAERLAGRPEVFVPLDQASVVPELLATAPGAVT